MGLRAAYPELANHLDQFKIEFETWKTPFARYFRCPKCHEHAQAGRKPNCQYEWQLTEQDVRNDPQAPQKAQAVLAHHQEKHRQHRIKFVTESLKRGIYREPNDDEMNPLPDPKL